MSLGLWQARFAYNSSMPDDGSQPQPIRTRLDELYLRPRILPQAESAVAALHQLCETLEQVEDDLSGIVRKSQPPPPHMPDGRMHRPSEDFMLRHPDGSILALTRGHRIEITATGGVRIVNKVTLQVEFEK
jgi:hypothetical protein